MGCLPIGSNGADQAYWHGSISKPTLGPGSGPANQLEQVAGQPIHLAYAHGAPDNIACVVADAVAV
jgi:serine/threonine protein phosphatase PrpC